MKERVMGYSVRTDEVCVQAREKQELSSRHLECYVGLSRLLPGAIQLEKGMTANAAWLKPPASRKKCFLLPDPLRLQIPKLVCINL